MTPWQRRTRLALGLFAVIFAGVVYLAIRERTPEPATQPARRDPKAVSESTGGEATLARGARSDFKVRFARALSYADGTTRFERVTVSVPKRGGRDFELRADRARVGSRQSALEMEGGVTLTASDGLEVRTERATYDDAEGVVRAPGDVRFSRARMTGQAVGATYDRARDVLWLLDRARITVAPEPQGGAGLEVVAGAAGFARRDRYLRFERSVRIVRGGQVTEASEAVAYLRPADDRLQSVQLRGASRVTGEGGAGLESMAARDIDLEYGDDGQTLRRATLIEEATVRLAGSEGRAGRRLAAGWIDLSMSPDGAVLTGLNARRDVDLEMPPDGAGPARRVRSQSLDAAGPPDKGLEQARFTGSVEFLETPPARKDVTASERVARSESLLAAVRPGFAGFDMATFAGGVTFRDGTLAASAPDAVYDVAKGGLRLTAPATTRGPTARVDDDRATVEARRIDVTLGERDLAASGGVKSVLKASRPGGTGAVRRPSVLRADQAVNVTADRLDYARAAGRATYTGQARLWQGETAIQGATIVLDDVRGNLSASDDVRSTLRLDDTDPKTGQTERKTTVITAGRMVYEDETRLAVYTIDARLSGPDGEMRAPKIELYLDRDGSALERAEAYEDVSLRSVRRSSFGTRLTYFAAEGRYLMRGAPVRVYEQLPGECRETLGRTLTFFRSTDSISVDGNEESRTRTTTGGKCPVAPVG